MPVSSVVQQPDPREGCEAPAYLFLPGVPATKHIPQQIRMDVVVVPCGQPGILELQTAVVYPCTDRRSEPLADGEAVRRFQPSEQVLATERSTEKSGRAPGDTDKPVAASAHRKYHPVEISRLHRLEQFGGGIMCCVSYSVLLRGMYIRPCLQ